MTSLLTEKLSSARLIKSFRLESYAAKRLNQSFEQVYDLRMRAVKARARLDPMLEALGGLAVAGVIAFAYWRIASGISTVGDFMGFITALLMAAQPIRALGNLSGRISEGLAAAESFYGLVDEMPRIVDAPNAKPLAVDLEHDPLRRRRLRLRRAEGPARDPGTSPSLCRAARRWPSSGARAPANRRC